MHSRLTSADLGNFFFQPFDLHLQAADLLVEFMLIRSLVGPPLPPVGEQLGHLGHELLFPSRHLARVDAELARQLGRCAVALGGRQGHLGLKRSPIHTSLAWHRHTPDRGPPSPEATPYQGARNPGSTSRSGSSIQAIPVADFTLVAATTEPYQILEPLRQRAKLHLELSFLSQSDLVTVVERRCRALSWDIEPAVLPEIAKRARGVPRLALRLTASARRVSRADGRTLITTEDLSRALELEQLDNLGLGPLESKYLKLLLEGPRRVNVLASALGVPSKTLSSVTEPFLIRAGLVDKDDSSKRVLTPEGRRHVLGNSSEIRPLPPSEGP
jgi:hypothetical protein